VVKSFEAEARVHIPSYSILGKRRTVFLETNVFLELFCATEA